MLLEVFTDGDMLVVLVESIDVLPADTAHYLQGLLATGHSTGRNVSLMTEILCYCQGHWV